MKKDDNIIVRVNSNVKENVQIIAEKYGVSLSSIINAFLVTIANTGRLPINIVSNAKKEVEKKEITVLEIILSLKEIIKKSNKHSINKVYLFGSYAKGTQTKNSDIDLRVEFNEGSSILELISLKMELENKLKKSIDIISINDYSDKFYDLIKDDEILIYESKW